MFIACRGLPVLVGFLEPDYAKFRYGVPFDLNMLAGRDLNHLISVNEHKVESVHHVLSPT
jgi:hypothetical protein